MFVSPLLIHPLKLSCHHIHEAPQGKSDWKTLALNFNKTREHCNVFLLWMVADPVMYKST